MHIKRVKSFLPASGTVSILTVTDKQYSNILHFWGEIQAKSPEVPQQLELFL